MRFYVGTYSLRDSQGIYVFDLNAKTGQLAPMGTSDGVANPSFVALHPNGRFLYAVGEGKDGMVAAYALGAGNVRRLLNQESSRGDAPCHIAVDPSGQNVLVANYMSGSIVVLPIATDGSLKPVCTFHQNEGASHVNPGRQEAPHAHMVNIDPSGNYALAADLGCDRLFVFRFDPIAGSLTPNEPPAAISNPGSGPRHFAFTPDGRHAFFINELSNTITANLYNRAKGALTEIQTVSTLPAGWTGHSTTAEIVVHPSGRYVYGTNRGHDSIAAFAIDAASGKLNPLGIVSSGGKTPRGFDIDPTGAWAVAANQDSDNIVVFRIDPATGVLTPAGIEAHVPAAVCVVFGK